ncbi:MAG TPA: bifunctional enoyl-CoA hydratase/phosphate acetyltransferase [bacterium]|nr:bifunctional enoyl-CoA hydratase/phosphate acetyltransferase [bacterium]
MVRSFDEIFKQLKDAHKSKKIAVAMPDNSCVLEALKEVEERGLAEVLLVGPRKEIESNARQVGHKIDQSQIYDVQDEKAIAEKSVELVRSGAADLLMKGRISTPVLMKAVLDKENGLRNGEIISHVGVMEVDTYDRLLAVSDGGINIAPNLDEKKAILSNLVKTLHGLGIKEPNVGLLCPIEKVNEKIEETVHADKLQKMAQKGEFGQARVEGPIAFDVAISKDAADKKGLDNKISGQADGLLVPGITSGNAFLKGMIYLANAKVGGVVVGAKVPIILLSRADNPTQKLCSIALAIYIS